MSQFKRDGVRWSRICPAACGIVALAALAASAQDGAGTALDKVRVETSGTADQMIACMEARKKLYVEWESKKVTAKGEEVPLKDVWELVEKSSGLKMRLSDAASDTGILISIRFDARPGTEVMSFIYEVTQLPIVVDKDNALWMVTEKEVRTIGAAGCREMILADELLWRISDDRFPELSPAKCAATREKVAGVRATLEITDVPLEDVLKELCTQTGLTIELYYTESLAGGRSKAKVTLAMKDQPLKDILEKLEKALGMKWYVQGSLVLLGTPEEAARWEAQCASEEKVRLGRTAGETRLLSREVNIPGGDLTMRQIGAQLETALGVPVRLDLGAAKPTRTWTLAAGTRPLSAIVKEINGDDRLTIGYREGILWILGGDPE